MKIKADVTQHVSSIPDVDFKKCPAKIYTDENGDLQLGFTVAEHCYITGCVARALVERLPTAYREFFPEGFDLLVACHDIGMISPTFFLKILQIAKSERLNEELAQQLLSLYSNPLEIDRQFNHSTISAVELKDYITGNAYIVAGSHHGALSQKALNSKYNAEIYGGEPWHEQRLNLIHWLEKRFQTSLPNIEDRITTTILSGLTSVSDWIASGGIFSRPYPNWEITLEDDIRSTLDQLGLQKPQIKQHLSFVDLFPHLEHANELQEQAYFATRHRGVYLVQAPMGSGKTEAALYMAYRALSDFDSTGIYYALPDQNTLKQAQHRFKFFLNNFLDHGAVNTGLDANVMPYEVTMSVEGGLGGEWFNHAKRGLLAPFGVGTLDELLLSALSVKHHFVRCLGLIGKVVILDEIQSYDVYTNLLLDRLVQNLVDLKCTVIILSATLTESRRKELIPHLKTASIVSPCILSRDNERNEEYYTPVSVTNHSIAPVVLKSMTMDASLSEALSRAKQGQCVLWIENTDDDAIHTYKQLIDHAHPDIEIGLIHSRFTPEDLTKLDDIWTRAFARNNPYRTDRGRILVGTPLLERSIDLDADFLVTRLAPCDFILQRLGRLWRHECTDRHASAKREAWVVCDELRATMANLSLLGSAAHVYSPYLLLKSLLALNVYFQQQFITIAHDAPQLIEETYRDDISVSDPLIKRVLHEQKNIFLYGHRHDKGYLKKKASAYASILNSEVVHSESVINVFKKNQSVNIYIFSNIHLFEGKIIFTIHNDRTELDLNVFNNRWDKSAIINLFQSQRISIPLDVINSDIHTKQSGFDFLNQYMQNQNCIFCIQDQFNVVKTLNGDSILKNGTALYTNTMGFHVIK